MPGDPRSLALGVGYRRVARPVLFRVGGSPERVHHAAVRAAGALGALPPARAALGWWCRPEPDPVDLFGLRFPHRIGLAAGMDKDGTALAGWSALGFGHVELGTVTARPQPGNPAPRVFRLPRSRAVVNRMGFNNAGAGALADRLRAARSAGVIEVPVGVSLGKSKATPVADAVSDYLTSVRLLHGLADYLAVNVSSPNTPGLRGLQDAGPLRELLAAVVGTTRELAGPHGRPTPVLVKLAPDLDDAALHDALQVVTDTGVAGVIATNTTVSREGVHPAERVLAAEPGGLSGAPLTRRAREVVARVSRLTDLPVIGAGGVMSAADAVALRDAGADLVQLWTGLVYAGPGLVRECTRALRCPSGAARDGAPG